MKLDSTLTKIHFAVSEIPHMPLLLHGIPAALSIVTFIYATVKWIRAE